MTFSFRELSQTVTPLALIVLLVLLASCSSTSTPPLEGSRSELLRDLANDVILPTYQTLQTRADALETALQAYATDPTTVNRDAARASFLSTMSAMQEAEVMQVGPLSPSDLSPGGTDIRGELYSWPLVSTCGVDRRVADGATVADLAALRVLSANVRGLDAIEYLLFNESAANTCTATATINTDGSWDTLAADADLLTARRATLAHSLGVLVTEQTDALVAAWAGDPSFLTEFTDPTRSGALYGTAQEGLNAVADALFYVDQATKDMKLAQPAGLTSCTATTCPEALESQFAGDSLARIEANLRGFRRVFVGGNGGGSLGFADLLTEIGAGDFATTMLADLDAAISAVAALGSAHGSLRAALDADLQGVTAAYDRVQVLTTHLKTQFLGVLSLDPPNRGGADND